MSGQAGFPVGIRAIDVTRALAGLPAGFGETAARRVTRRVGEITAAAARDNLRKTLGALVQTSGEAATLGGPRCPR